MRETDRLLPLRLHSRAPVADINARASIHVRMSSAASPSSNSQAPLDALAAAAGLQAGSTAAAASPSPLLATVVEDPSTPARPVVAAAAAAAVSPAAAPPLAAASSSASLQPISSSSASAAAAPVPPIKLLIPKALLCRTSEVQPTEWLYRETPSIYRALVTAKSIGAGQSAAAAASLWSAEEQAAIDRIFPLPSCKQKLSQPDHIFSSLFVASPPATPTDTAAAAASSVRYCAQRCTQ